MLQRGSPDDPRRLQQFMWIISDSLSGASWAELGAVGLFQTKLYPQDHSDPEGADSDSSHGEAGVLLLRYVQPFGDAP